SRPMSLANYPSSELVIDPVLIRNYDVSGPRYTSYPTADRFVEAFGEQAYRQALGARGLGGFTQPLSLYVHVPFCRDICFYFRWNKKVTRDKSEATRYLEDLEAEMRLLDGALRGERRLAQMHWGGGTPTFLGRENMAAPVGKIDRYFGRDARCECAIEVDPGVAEPGLMAFLAELGFSRVSLGVQDFDPAVQHAIHRVQPYEMTARVM